MELDRFLPTTLNAPTNAIDKTCGSMTYWGAPDVQSPVPQLKGVPNRQEETQTSS